MKAAPHVNTLYACVSSLGLRLGWKYWRLQKRALVNPWFVLDWAKACDAQANKLDAAQEGLLAQQHRQWAAELRNAYQRFTLPCQPQS